MPGCSVQRWSLSLGRWWGVSVYLHFFFLFSVVLALAFTNLETDLMSAALIAIGLLLVSVMLHEVGHALAAIRVGGKVDAVVLGPVGGLLSPRVPDEPEIHLFVALAGPIVHLLLAVVAAVALAVAGNRELLGLLNPLDTPHNLFVDQDSTAIVAAKLMLWLNWNLMLVNLLPTYPFDGGPILRSMLWPALGRRTARIYTARIAMGIAVMLCAGSAIIAYDFGKLDVASRFPVWIPLVMLGVFMFFSARQDLATASVPEWNEEPAGYQVSSDGLDLLDVMWSSDDDADGVLVEHQQRTTAEQDEQAQEAIEDARVDDILGRLHEASWAALSPDEIAVLQRASQRYRRRRSQAD
jgi:Zn-dependent protease